MHEMKVPKLVVVALCCPWRGQGEIVPPEGSILGGLALGDAHFSPLTAAKASAFFSQK